MKGIVLAGGSGSRLYPLTKGISKQLLPVYDKPMIYYPISVLMLAGIKDILVITTPHDQEAFQRLLGDGKEYGISLSYLVQPAPDGIAQAFVLGKDFIGTDDVCLILGDNIFYGQGLSPRLQQAVRRTSEHGKATIFGYQVMDAGRFGVVEFDESFSAVSIEEKPDVPRSTMLSLGFIFFPMPLSI